MVIHILVALAILTGVTIAVLTPIAGAVLLLRRLRHEPNPYRASVAEPDAIDEEWALWAPIFERGAS